MTSPYSGRGRQLELELDLALHALDRAQQQVGRAEPEVVVALALGERDRVDDLDAARLGREGRLDHQRSRQVAALAAIRAGGLIDQCPPLGSRIRANTAGLS